MTTIHKIWLVVAAVISPLLIMAQSVSAEAKGELESSPSLKHEVRIGWGDMMFETMAFHDSPSHNWASPESIDPNYTTTDRINHHYTGHFFADYHYNALPWLAVGGQIDFEGIFWQETTYDAKHIQIGAISNIASYNTLIMATVRFTYFHSQLVNLYSGLGLGVGIASDNSNAVEAGAAFNLNLFSVCVGNDRWFGSLELGMLNSLQNQNRVYMLGSRLISASVGYRF